MDFLANVPIYIQVISDIKKSVVTGELTLGQKLPSTRELAVKYQINPNTAVRVYNEMEQAGLCYTKRGLGTFVTEDENVLSSIKKDMADNCINGYIREMAELGYSRDEMLGIIEEYLERG